MSARNGLPCKGRWPKGPEGSPKPPNPCRGCTKRHPHCHGDCEPYLAFYNWHRAENDARHRESLVHEVHMEAILKAKQYARQMKGKKT